MSLCFSFQQLTYQFTDHLDSALVASIVGLVYRAQYYTAGDDNIRLVVPLWVTW